MRGKVLGIRTGHLANFSGGAGFMPFIVFLSVPASLLSTIISTILIYFISRKTFDSKKDNNSQPIDISALIVYTKRHLHACLIISIIAATAFLWIGSSAIFFGGFFGKVRYFLPLLFLAVGPIASFLLSSFVLIKKVLSNGPKIGNLMVSFLVYVVSIIVSILCGWLTLALSDTLPLFKGF